MPNPEPDPISGQSQITQNAHNANLSPEARRAREMGEKGENEQQREKQREKKSRGRSIRKRAIKNQGRGKVAGRVREEGAGESDDRDKVTRGAEAPNMQMGTNHAYVYRRVT